MGGLRETDACIAELLAGDRKRQNACISLNASENYMSSAVREAVGSPLSERFAIGYPGRRLYGGCEEADAVEKRACERACKLFGSPFANVQSHSHPETNLAAYMALLEPGETILGLAFDQGGHFSHGSNDNFSGCFYRFESYYLDPREDSIDYGIVRDYAKRFRPRVIVAGSSTYPRAIDYEEIGLISKEVGAYFVADMTHSAGLVAAGACQNPVPYADVVTASSGGTLRGPQGGFILSNDEGIARKIDESVFPGIQDAPQFGSIAGKAVAFEEARSAGFREYIRRVLRNAAALADGMKEGGLYLVTGGTDTHLCLADVESVGVDGREAEQVLESVGLAVSRSPIPYEQKPMEVASGIRVGAAAATTRGVSEDEFHEIGLLIASAISRIGDEAGLAAMRRLVGKIASAHPAFVDDGRKE